MKTTITKNYEQKLRNSIATTRNADFREIKENLAKGLSMLFIDNGTDYIWGIDSCFTTQVSGAQASNKSQVIAYLTLSLNSLTND